MTDSNSTPTHEQISRRAYEIFIERGQPASRDLEHWLEAEKQLRAAGPGKSAPQTITTAPVRATQPAASNGNGRSQGNGRARTATARK